VPQNDTIVVVDDDSVFRLVAEAALSNEGYAVRSFESCEACLASTCSPSAVLLDLGLAGLSGRDAVVAIMRWAPAAPVVVISASSAPRIIADVTAAGAYDYIVKPATPKRLATTVRNAVERFHMARVRDSGGLGDVDSPIIGRSRAMRRLTQSIAQVAASDVSVLISGESGTGKELVARRIHALSPRRDGPFVEVNCAAIPDALGESHMFGHEKGAFTGATARHLGMFERASGGTLFLDEIAELSPALQSKVLRVLQEHRLQRVGGTETVSIDFRVLAATHKRLRKEVDARRFREDLFFRLVVFEIEVPPLRKRDGDIGVLVDHFARSLGPTVVGRHIGLSPESLSILESHAWPGNVRQLQNALIRGMVNATGELVLPSDLPSWITARETAFGSIRPAPAAALVFPDDMSLAEIERLAIQQAVERAAGNVSQAARSLGISRSTLYRKMRD
jgi:two-component system, NtrC family, response regulator HydG